MNSFHLIKTHTTGTGSMHVQVKINGNDVGLLYLNTEEVDILMNILRDGLVNSNTLLETDLSCENINDDSEYY